MCDEAWREGGGGEGVSVRERAKGCCAGAGVGRGRERLWLFRPLGEPERGAALGFRGMRTGALWRKPLLLLLLLRGAPSLAFLPAAWCAEWCVLARTRALAGKRPRQEHVGRRRHQAPHAGVCVCVRARECVLVCVCVCGVTVSVDVTRRLTPVASRFL
jgi:hypothetical protein